MRASHHAGEGCAGAREEPTACAALGRREGARAARCEPLPTSTAREPVFEPPCAAGVVKLLALAVPVHGESAELALSRYMPKMSSTL
jgi:hypothetical protein